ncbi:hypothetical protein ACSEOG_15180 [Pseudomonas paraeruginosa]
MSRRLMYSVLLGHYLSAFTALGVPLFLPRILADLAPGTPGWAIGVLFVLPTLCTALAAPVWGRRARPAGPSACCSSCRPCAPRWRPRSGAAWPTAMGAGCPCCGHMRDWRSASCWPG